MQHTPSVKIFGHKLRLVTDEFIFIENDNSLTTSITNLSNEVIDLLENLIGIGSRRVFYLDSEGVIDEILTDKGIIVSGSDSKEMVAKIKKELDRSEKDLRGLMESWPYSRNVYI